MKQPHNIIKQEGKWCLYIKDEISTISTEKKACKDINLTSELFLSCPFINYIFQGQQVLFIIVAGSRLVNLTDEFSDFDLIVFTKQYYKPKIEYRLSYDGKVIHWYYRTFTELLELTHPLELCGLYQFQYLKANSYLYLDDHAKSLWEIFYKNRFIISQFGFESSYFALCTPCQLFLTTIENYKNNLTEVLANNSLAGLPLKFYHKILHMYYNVFNIDYNKDFILKVKRMRYTPLSNDDMQHLIKDIQAYLDAMSNYKFNINNLKEQWLNLWLNQIESIKQG